MIFDTPLPFQEALDSRVVRSLLPTDLRTDLLDTIPAALRERSIFSAGVQQANTLQAISDQVDRLLGGQTDTATARTELKRLLGSLGAEVDETDLTDLRSDARLNLILETNLQQAQGAGYKLQGEQLAVLDQWPAWELVRIQEAREPRDWPARWAAAGGTFFGGRMIALKADPIWRAINRFGVDYPPFDFGSHMDVVDVDYDTAVAAGLIEDGADVPAPEPLDLNAELQASPQAREQWLRSALAESLQGVAAFDANGVLRAI